MPYSEKATRFFQAVEHGMKPRKGNLSPQKAGQLLDEAKARKEGQKKAIGRMT